MLSYFCCTDGIISALGNIAALLAGIDQLRRPTSGVGKEKEDCGQLWPVSLGWECRRVSGPVAGEQKQIIHSQHRLRLD